MQTNDTEPTLAEVRARRKARRKLECQHPELRQLAKSAVRLGQHLHLGCLHCKKTQLVVRYHSGRVIVS